MSDEEIRSLERRWRESGDPAAGEAWVDAVLRTTGLPVSHIISLLIQVTRIIRTSRDRLTEAALTAGRAVSPDDIVAFLRGGPEFPRGTFALPNGMSQPSIEEDLEALGLTTPPVIDDDRLCEHANEVPRVCPCESNCRCRRNGNSCSDVSPFGGDSDRKCDYCSDDALWFFRGVGGPSVCEAHLTSVRHTRDVRRRLEVDEHREHAVLSMIDESDVPLPITSFPAEYADVVRSLIARELVGVTSDWHVWPRGKSLDGLCNCGAPRGFHRPRAGCV